MPSSLKQKGLRLARYLERNMPVNLFELEKILSSHCLGKVQTSLDDGARCALLHLVRRAGAVTRFPPPMSAKPNLCPNCASDASGVRSPYCSDQCRCEAAFVRQYRSCLESGAILNADRQIALGENLWQLLGGLYPRRQGMVLERVLKRVMKRVHGRCEKCGAPATTVDHIGSG